MTTTTVFLGEVLVKINTLVTVELENLKETYSKLQHVFLHFEIEICVPSIVEEHKYNKREDFIDFVHCISLVPRTMPVNIRL